MDTPLLIKDGRIIDPSQGVDQVGDLLVEGGKISRLHLEARPTPLPEAYALLDAGGLVVCPGLIDLHCHLREPGYEDKETIATGTLAAARGGFTTVCAMPNTNPPMDTRATVDYVMMKGKEEGVVRVLPIGCITKGREGREMAELAELAEAGVIGFSDDGNPVADANIMRQALTYMRGSGLPIINHCEEPSLFQGGVANEGWVSTRLGLKGVPAAAEEVMASRDIGLAALTGGHVHLAHISTAGTVEMVRRAKEKGIAVTCEATPHHLTLNEHWVMGYRNSDTPFATLDTEAYDTYTKVNPPLRSREDVQAVVEGLKEGVIDVVATDHAPHTQVDKLCTYQEAAFGISNFETALASVMSLVHAGHVHLPTLIERMTWAPARILGRDLGTLRPGAPADITLFDPQAEWVVDTSMFASKGKNTPLKGVTLRGKLMATIVGGDFAYKDESLEIKAHRSSG